MSDSSLTLLEAAPGPDNPLGMLGACHRRLEARLETFRRVVEVYQRHDEERYDQAAGAAGLVIRHMQGPSRLHTADEELSLFPRLAARDGAIAHRLALLELDHERLEILWASLLPDLARLAEGGEPSPEALAKLAQGVAELQEGYRRHLQDEDETIFPEAARLLSEADLAALGQEMAQRRHLV